MQSNKTYHRIFKYGLLGAGVLKLVISTLSWLFPQLIKVNRKSIKSDLTTTMIFGLIGIFLRLLFFAIKDKFVLVNMGNQSVVIKTKLLDKRVNWIDVEFISLIQFVYPPLYKVKI